MKQSHVILAILISGLLFSCGDDDPFSPLDGDLLRYDGENQSSPLLEPGDHELAVYFPARVLKDAGGKKLVQIEVYAGSAPQTCQLRVREGNTATSPGNILYQKDITSQVQGSPRWIIHTLDTPVDITGDEDLWISVAVTHTNSSQTIGCDAGPRRDGGDWIWQSANGTWQTFQQLTGTESVNWNLRGVVE